MIRNTNPSFISIARGWNETTNIAMFPHNFIPPQNFSTNMSQQIFLNKYFSTNMYHHPKIHLYHPQQVYR